MEFKDLGRFWAVVVEHEVLTFIIMIVGYKLEMNIKFFSGNTYLGMTFMRARVVRFDLCLV